MKNKSLLRVIMLSMVLALGACGSDIEPVKMFYDTNGKVFLENGDLTEATTDFTTEELLARLQANAWRRDYVIFYDNKKVSETKVNIFSEENYFVFAADGTGYMGVVSSSHKTPLTYTASGREVTINIDGQHLVMRVAGFTQKMLVVDSSAQGLGVKDFDDATVVQRTVFKAYQLIE